MAQKHSLPDLPYDYGDLAPVIDAEIMTLHHSKHHNTYVAKLNEALEKYSDAEGKGDVAAMIALQSAINFNGGGHVNHSIFWTNLAPPSKGGGVAPEGPLAGAMTKDFGSVQAFMEMFNAFWAGHVADLEPTAGYYVDGRRFFSEISSAARQMGVSENLLYRSR